MTPAGCITEIGGAGLLTLGKAADNGAVTMAERSTRGAVGRFVAEFSTGCRVPRLRSSMSVRSLRTSASNDRIASSDLVDAESVTVAERAAAWTTFTMWS